MPDALDPQSAAFREAGDDDWVSDQQIAEVATVHDGPVRTPEEYEGWDAGREGAKSLDEAREALAARIADPAAPEDEQSAGAYDNAGGGA